MFLTIVQGSLKILYCQEIELFMNIATVKVRKMFTIQRMAQKQTNTPSLLPFSIFLPYRHVVKPRSKLTMGRVPSDLPSKLLLFIRPVLEVTGAELTNLRTITISKIICTDFSCPRRFIMTSN